MSGGGGGTTVNVPEPSAEERALQQAQVDLLNQQRDLFTGLLGQQNLLQPLLYEAAGIRPTFEAPVNNFAQNQALQQELSDLRAERERILNDTTEADRIQELRRRARGKQGDRDQRAAAELRRLIATRGPGALQGGGADTSAIDSQIKSIEDQLARSRAAQALGQPTGFERIEDPLAARRQEIESLLLDRTLAALKGDLPENPALLRNIEDRRRTLEEQLRRQLGPGYATSTPGQRALAEFERQGELLLDASRRADLNQSETLSLNRQAGQEDLINQFFGRATGAVNLPISGIAGLGQVAQGFNSPISALQQQRALQTQAAIANAQANAQSQSGLFSGIGNVVGLGLSGGFGGLFGGGGSTLSPLWTLG